MHHPKISVITVVYNGKNTVEKTIQSVLGQGYDNIEYIIIDGGSTDGTLNIIRRYANKITKWISEKDNGIYDAMNKGVSHATGDIIAFLNSDDWYFPDAISYVAEQFLKEDIDILFSGVTRQDEDEKRTDRYPKIFSSEEGYERIAVFHPSTFAQKKIFGKIGLFNISYKIAADYEWLIRVKKHGFYMKCIDYVTTYYSDGGISNKYWEEAQNEAEKIELKYAESIEEREYIKLLYGNNICTRKYMEMLDQGCQSCFFSNEIELYVSKSTYIFGAGNMGKECAQLLLQSGVEIKGFIDKNRKKWGNLFEGYMVMPLKELNIEKDFVVISSIQYEKEMRKELKHIGMTDEKIISYAFLRDKIIDRLKTERNISGI